MSNIQQDRWRFAFLITALIIVVSALLAIPVSSLTAQDNALSLTDFEQSGLEVEVLALFEAGGSETLYSDPNSRWGQSGSLVSGDIALSEDTSISRIMVPNTDGSLLRLNHNGSLVFRDYIDASGSGHDLTVWIQTDVATVSFPANDVQSVGNSYINFNVPTSSRYVLTDFVQDDRFILALTRPASDSPPADDPPATEEPPATGHGRDRPRKSHGHGRADRPRKSQPPPNP